MSRIAGRFTGEAVLTGNMGHQKVAEYTVGYTSDNRFYRSVILTSRGWGAGGMQHMGCSHHVDHRLPPMCQKLPAMGH